MARQTVTARSNPYLAGILQAAGNAAGRKRKAKKRTGSRAGRRAGTSQRSNQMAKANKKRKSRRNKISAAAASRRGRKAARTRAANKLKRSRAAKKAARARKRGNKPAANRKGKRRSNKRRRNVAGSHKRRATRRRRNVAANRKGKRRSNARRKHLTPKHRKAISRGLKRLHRTGKRRSNGRRRRNVAANRPRRRRNVAANRRYSRRPRRNQGNGALVPALPAPRALQKLLRPVGKTLRRVTTFVAGKAGTVNSAGGMIGAFAGAFGPELANSLFGVARPGISEVSAVLNYKDGKLVVDAAGAYQNPVQSNVTEGSQGLGYLRRYAQPLVVAGALGLVPGLLGRFANQKWGRDLFTAAITYGLGRSVVNALGDLLGMALAYVETTEVVTKPGKIALTLGDWLALGAPTLGVKGYGVGYGAGQSLPIEVTPSQAQLTLQRHLAALRAGASGWGVGRDPAIANLERRFVV